MNSWTVLQLALLVMAFLLVILSTATSVQRFTRSRAMAKREQQESIVRPRLMRLLSDDEPDLSSLDGATSSELRVLESIVWQLLSKVRGATRAALVEWLETRGAIERARARTMSRSAVRRATAAEALGAAGVIATSPDVVRLLDDKDAEVRIVAARALGKLGDARTVPALLESISGEDGLPTSIVSMSLLHMGPAAIDGLVAGLGSKSPIVRGVSADLLGMHGAIKAERWLTLMVQHDPVTEVQVHAASALGRIGSPRSIDVLSRATAPASSEQLRVAATRSLGLIGGSNAVASLQILLSDENENVGRAAAAGLASSGPAGESVLETAALGDGAGAGRATDWTTRVELDHGARRHRAHHAIQRGSQ